MSSLYLSQITAGVPDDIVLISSAFQKCTNPNKVNVSIGAYRDEEGKPYLLPSVLEAERRILQDAILNKKEYPPPSGDPTFVQLALQFAYGKDADIDLEQRVAGVQTLSGTGALRLAAEFYARFLPSNTRIYLPHPTWLPHPNIFGKGGGMEVRHYRYWNFSTNQLDWNGMVEDLQEAPSESVVLFHTCAHNPTGWDPTLQQWKELSELCRDKSLHVLFDSAYQGFASGDPEADAAPLRLFVKDGHFLLHCQSFSKNFGLYGERCGTLSVVCHNLQEKQAIQSQLGLIGRGMYGRPPIHGALIVKTILSNADLTAQYLTECREMSQRIQTMRTLLVTHLAEAGSTHDWSHMKRQIGMFAYSGMTPEMCNQLTSEFFIFLTRDGRISLAGLNKGNIVRVAEAIHQVTLGKELNNGSSK